MRHGGPGAGGDDDLWLQHGTRWSCRPVDDFDMFQKRVDELRPFRYVSAKPRVGGGNLDPQAGDLAVTSGWGHAGQGGVTMPGKGKSIPRPYPPEEFSPFAVLQDAVVTHM